MSKLVFSAVAAAGAAAIPLAAFSVCIARSHILHRQWYNGIVASLHTWQEAISTRCR